MSGSVEFPSWQKCMMRNTQRDAVEYVLSNNLCNFKLCCHNLSMENFTDVQQNN